VSKFLDDLEHEVDRPKKADAVSEVDTNRGTDTVAKVDTNKGVDSVELVYTQVHMNDNKRISPPPLTGGRKQGGGYFCIWLCVCSS
jgi:hypothetical protein